MVSRTTDRWPRRVSCLTMEEHEGDDEDQHDEYEDWDEQDDIESVPTPFGITPTQLETFCRAIATDNELPELRQIGRALGLDTSSMSSRQLCRAVGTNVLRNWPQYSALLRDPSVSKALALVPVPLVALSPR